MPQQGGLTISLAEINKVWGNPYSPDYQHDCVESFGRLAMLCDPKSPPGLTKNPQNKLKVYQLFPVIN